MHGSGARGQFFLIDLNGGFAPIVLFAFDLDAAFIAVWLDDLVLRSMVILLLADN
ncbi:Uncharacterised protein [Serratia fonticola]|uniref:Uncharacterized protein n=1 Tax=Serratia fonticola TaxID=47917 RepID=A0A4U9UVN3_SERFO|nr:Uncharacterised protein [Serratia fonticola]